MFKFIRRLILLLTLLITVVTAYLYIDYQQFLNTPIKIAGQSKVFSIHPGEGLVSVTKRLGEENIVLGDSDIRPVRAFTSSHYFHVLGRLNKQANKLKIGDYQLIDGMTPSALMQLFVDGKVIEFKIRFLEGWRFTQFLDEIKKHPNIEQTLEHVPLDEMMQALGYGNQHYEGMFFPDTYQFANKTQDVEILRIAYSLMQKELENAWAQRDKNSFLATPYELLTLASIIEKETSLDEERDEISGVFHRRIGKKMPLQTDPTVIYGMGDSYNGRLLYSHLKIDTPYNTYTRKGLTPSPIAMPGKASLLAAGQPKAGNSLFFVATGDGGHKFTATYKEHLKAVAEYRKKQAQEGN